MVVEDGATRGGAADRSGGTRERQTKRRSDLLGWAGVTVRRSGERGFRMRILCGPIDPIEGARILEDSPDTRFFPDDLRSFDTIWASLPADWQPDVVVFVSPEYRALPVGIEDCPVPFVIAVGDWNLGLSRILPTLDMADLVVTDKLGVDTLRRLGLPCVDYWPMFSFDPTIHRPRPDEPVRYDVSFVGNFNHDVHQERARLLAQVARLSDRFRIAILTSVTGDAYGRVLSQSRLIFNRSVRREMNMRAFEACAAGRTLLMEADNLEIRDFLIEGEQFVAYTPETLEDVITDLLRDPERSARIATAGCQRIQSVTLRDQFQRLRRLLADYPFASRPPRRWHARGPSDKAAARVLQHVGTVTPGALAAVIATAPHLATQFPDQPQVLHLQAVLLAVGSLVHDVGIPAGHQRADEAFCHLVARFPGYALAWFNLARLRLIRQQHEGLDAILSRAANVLRDPGLFFFDDLFLPVTYDRLRVEWERHAARGDRAGICRILRADVLWRLAALRRADVAAMRQLLEEAATLDPDSPAIWEDLGQCRAWQGDDGWQAAWETSLAILPFQFDLRHRLITALLQSGRRGRARHWMHDTELLLRAIPLYDDQWGQRVEALWPRAHRHEDCWVIRLQGHDRRWEAIVLAYVRAFAPTESVALYVLIGDQDEAAIQETFTNLAAALAAAGYDQEHIPDVVMTVVAAEVPAWATPVRQEATVADWAAWFAQSRL